MGLCYMDCLVLKVLCLCHAFFVIHVVVVFCGLSFLRGIFEEGSVVKDGWS